MATQQKKISKTIDAIIADLRNDLAKKGINASGKLSNSLGNRSKGNKGELWGNSYFEYIVFGRERTKNGGDGSLYERIKQWVNEKPAFSNMQPAEKLRFAYFTTRKIHREGTQRGRSAQYPGLSAQQIFDKHTEKLKPEILGDVRAEFLAAVRRGLG